MNRVLEALRRDVAGLRARALSRRTATVEAVDGTAHPVRVTVRYQPTDEATPIVDCYAGVTVAVGDIVDIDESDTARPRIRGVITPAAEEDPEPTVAPGDTLDLVAYQPGSASITSANGTSTALDTTNLKTTFTVPASGDVLVQLSANARVFDGVSDGLLWQLSTSTSGGTVAAQGYAGKTTVASGDIQSKYHRATVYLVVTGLTPAAEVTYYWRHAEDGSVNPFTAYGGNYGAAVMKVTAL